MSMMRTIAIAALATASAGCATIIRGTDTEFRVNTTPEGAQVSLSTGETCDATPCTFKVPRKSAFTAVITKEGYQTVQQNITHYWSKAGTTTGIVGNAILGGGIGVGVDAATGANLDIEPNPLEVTLEPIAPVEAADAAVPVES